jgi:hypothetical protein
MEQRNERTVSGHVERTMTFPENHWDIRIKKSEGKKIWKAYYN